MFIALLFVIYHQTQTNNFAGKVGKVILHLRNRERSYVFYGKEMQSAVERKDKIISQTQIRLHFRRLVYLSIYIRTANLPSGSK